MCQHHAPPRPGQRAIALEHGPDHDRDHAAWSRRGFLHATAAAGASTFLLGALPVRASSATPLLQRLSELETDRALVLIQMSGGNDGLNTVVPVTNGLYYERRPTIALPEAQTFALSDDYGLHGAMASLQPMWGDGHLAVVHAAGYPQHNLSHFRSTDIWASASNANEVLNSGWTGRYLDVEYPDYIPNPPPYPVAVRIGGASGLLMRGNASAMGISFSDPDQFERLAETGQYYDENNVPPTMYGQELSFVRSVYNAAFRYREAVVEAAEAGTNTVPYPAGSFAESLAIVARLIKGQLGARLYVVEIGGFDTHSAQGPRQAQLLGLLADAVTAFYADLAETNAGERVLTLTFSEFGRRVEENGAQGTDHGTAAPLFAFGDGVAGGLLGQGPDLGDLDPNGNLRHTTDFRQVYATVLRHWFGLSEADTSAVLGGTFAPLSFVAHSVAGEPGPGAPTAALLEAPYPNPFATAATVAFTLDQPGHVNLEVFDVRGRLVATLADGPQTTGRHVVRLDGADLPTGTYLIRMASAAGVQTRTVALIR